MPADVTGERPDIRADVTSAVVQDSALRIQPLPLPPTIASDDDQPGEAGLTLRIREAPDDAPDTPDTDTPDAIGVTPAGVLPPDRTALLLARLPALPSPDTTAFRFPAASPAPPRTGRIVLSPFPPPDTVPAAPMPTRVELPLRVVRIVPTGATELAPHLTITFSEAMVPLTTVAGTDARTVPVRLSPQPPGRWSWIDTRTLRFQPADVPGNDRAVFRRCRRWRAEFHAAHPANHRRESRPGTTGLRPVVRGTDHIFLLLLYRPDVQFKGHGG
jgi:hypothetical protein